MTASTLRAPVDLAAQEKRGNGYAGRAESSRRTVIAYAATAVRARQTTASHLFARGLPSCRRKATDGRATGAGRPPCLVPACDADAMVYWDTMLAPSSSITLRGTHSPHCQDGRTGSVMLCFMTPRQERFLQSGSKQAKCIWTDCRRVCVVLHVSLTATYS